ncbi:hypothetical protein FGO68_gene9855 [Halteria grandinella]|uniref:Alginate lyase 2 domain-containing protein n=1 Tax=Halteria grandinella TaxID=5974 RepID=A0A8J8NIS3_HALGN|nr:hypothetical protein FGO68_gene9855 [Halteria grandinella]
MKSTALLLLSLVGLATASEHHHAHHFLVNNVGSSPTDGFSRVSFDAQRDGHVQVPCNADPATHYHFYGQYHSFTVHDDELGWNCKDPHGTHPRSEMSLISKKFMGGKNQFQAWLTVPQGTYGVNLMQVFGGDQHNTAFMLHIYKEDGGSLWRYHHDKIKGGMWDKEFKLNVIHDSESEKVSVYIDDEYHGTYDTNGRSKLGYYYFKTGVYMQTEQSHTMKVKVRDITLWKKQ